MKKRGDMVVYLARHYELGPGGCWNWTGCTVDGYGQIMIGLKLDGTRRVVRVHRLAASIWKGFDLSSSLCVLHTCDNRRCFYPDHLFKGTRTINNMDCMSKGRDRHPKGGDNGRSKLTATQVVEIRQACANGERKTDLSRRYGVVESVIGDIVRRKIWAHVV
jgi:hypothetical protein